MRIRGGHAPAIARLQQAVNTVAAVIFVVVDVVIIGRGHGGYGGCCGDGLVMLIVDSAGGGGVCVCCCGLMKVWLGKNHKLSRARFVVFMALGSDESLRNCNFGTQSSSLA